MKKLGIGSLLVVALLSISLMGLCSCAGPTEQSSSSAESSSSAFESSASADAGRAGQSASQDSIAHEGATTDAFSGQGGAGGSSGQAGQQAESAQEAKPQEIQVSVSIQSSNAEDKSFGTVSRSVTLDPGASAYDALVATGVSVSGPGSYITSINGLAEKACGPTSGWTYYVNGDFLPKPANKARLSNGDSVIWHYVKSPDERL